MPTGSRREDEFIRLFISAYQDRSWAKATIAWPDKEFDNTVDAIATKETGQVLAVEHTIIEPFESEKQDFAFFQAAFLRIEEDKSLPVPGRGIQVFVPVGTLRDRPSKTERNAIVDSVHAWIKTNRLAIRDGDSRRACAITGVPGKASYEITLTLKSVPLRGAPYAETGSLFIRRQQVENSLGEVVEKALRKKLPKLVGTQADARVLMLERQHMNLYPQSMLDEVELRRDLFPDLAKVSEIWILETIFYGTPFGGTYLRFERYEGGDLVGSFDFNGGKLESKFEHGIREVNYDVPEVPR
jgi:hypothetical protein